MPLPEGLRGLNPEQLAREAWGSTVDIVEIMRTSTLAALMNFFSNMAITAILKSSGLPPGPAMEEALANYSRYETADAVCLFYCSFTRNLLRDVSLEEFIDHGPMDFVRRYVLEDNGEIPPQHLLKHVPDGDHPFWYGMLQEGRELSVSVDGLQRVDLHVFEANNVTPEQCKEDKILRDRLGKEWRRLYGNVEGAAIRTVLAGRLAVRSLLERDRCLEKVDDTFSTATQILHDILRRERETQG